MKTRISPRLLSIPACTAAVCPKFLRKLTTLTWGSSAASWAIFSVLPSRLPSSM